MIAYDSRHGSAEFALEAAKMLGAHGIKSFVFQESRPTPELSFAVRCLRTYAGIMITASHNPAEYNGYKVDGENGAQAFQLAIQYGKETGADLLLATDSDADRLGVVVKNNSGDDC